MKSSTACGRDAQRATYDEDRLLRSELEGGLERLASDVVPVAKVIDVQGVTQTVSEMEHAQIDRTLLLEHFARADLLVVEGNVYSKAAHVIDLLIGPRRSDDLESVRLGKLGDDPADPSLDRIEGGTEIPDKITHAPTAPRKKVDDEHKPYCSCGADAQDIGTYRRQQ